MPAEWKPVYQVEGRVVEPGRLYQIRNGTWAEPAPVACPQGHRFGPNRSLVGSRACMAVGGSHRLHTCVECGATVFTPPMRGDCEHPGN